MANLFERRIICEEKECTRYELLMDECLKIHKLVFYGDQHFEEGHRSIEQVCNIENEKIKCSTLIETNIQGKPKYRDEKGDQYLDIESY